MNELQIFHYDNAEIRTLERDDEVWFVGKDVAEILGYERGTKAVVERVDEEDRKMVDGKTQSYFRIELGQRGGWLINESGLYSLIMSSKLPSAKQFKRWVTSEVLPAIRKHGAYMTKDIAQQAVDNPNTIFELAKALLEEHEKNAALQPKADYAERCLMATSGVSMTSIAKELGMSAVKLNRILHGLGIQYKSGKQWVLYAKYQNKGYVVTRTIPITHADGQPDVRPETLWTQKGKQFIYKQLELAGIAK